MYKIQVARVKLSNLISKSKFINTDQMSIHLFPVMHLYALQYEPSVSKYVEDIKNWNITLENMHLVGSCFIIIA